MPNSFVGYRVREQFADLPAPTDAVGRTSAVTGPLTVDGLQRHGRGRQGRPARSYRATSRCATSASAPMGLETDKFPIAEFKLTDPIVFASRPAAGPR